MRIMAPAGDFDRLAAAVKAGADEVYMGVAGFGARRFAKNFSVDEYAAAIDFAHRSNVSVHLTFNTVLSDAELELVYPDMKRLYESGLDEVIVQDFGVVSWFRDNFPELSLCASTQLSPGNAAELNWYEKRGFNRAVLARELSFDEIRSIRAKTKIELEVFASGALCLGCSGKCYLSSFIGGRSGNRGMCAQPCRQYYRVEKLETSRKNDSAPQNASSRDPRSGDFGYFLSLKDQLQGKNELAELLEIGVDSIKVEGRMKSPIYVYEVVRYYRDLLDELTGVSKATAEKRLSVKKSTAETRQKSQNVPKFARKSPDAAPVDADSIRSEAERRQNIAAIFNRGYDFGFLREHDPEILNEFFASNFGVEIGRTRRGCVRLARPLRNGDGVVFLDETARKIGGLNVAGIRLVDPTNARRVKIVESAEPGDLVQFDVPVPKDAAFLYRTFDWRLNREIENALKLIRRREPINAKLVAKVGSPLELTLSNARAAATVRAETPLEKSQKIGADSASLTAALDRFGETAFYLNRAEIVCDPDVFVPKSLLNALRQEAVAALEANVVAAYRRVAPPQKTPEISDSAPTPQNAETPLLSGAALLPYFSATVRSRSQFDVCRALGIRKIYFETQPIQYENRLRFQETFRTLDGAAPLAGSLAEAIRFDADSAPFSLDWTFNVANARAVRYLADRFPNADVLFLSPEISERACDALLSKLAKYRAERRLTLGLPVYGRLLAMFTQKTLFDAEKVRLTNADDRRFLVEKNAARLPSTGTAAGDAAQIVGSSVYLPEPLDLRDAIPWILRSGIGEVRFDFTDESAAEIEKIVRRALAPSDGKYSTFSFGYSRSGIF